VKLTLPLLFPLTGSLVTLLEIEAVLLLDMPPAGTNVSSDAVAVTVMSSVEPEGIAARVHVTTRVA
jgi:hypothetical protein